MKWQKENGDRSHFPPVAESKTAQLGFHTERTAVRDNIETREASWRLFSYSFHAFALGPEGPELVSRGSQK